MINHTFKMAFGVQCLSGTGSLRVAAEFLTRVLGRSIIYVSSPTWGNHKLVFKMTGFSEIREHRYWDANTRQIDMAGFLDDLEAAPEQSVVLLHGCAHNPTGMDPSHDEWKQICKVMKRKRLLPFFDIAYQGFASGNPDEDAWAIRHFASEGLEIFCAQSFAKNFGLYNERIGNLTVVLTDKAAVAPVKSQLSILIRANWSNPPNHGAKIVHMVLTNPELKAQWFGHIEEMSSRVRRVRTQLQEHLEALATPGTWTHVTRQIGMFSYTGLNETQCRMLTHKYHIYLLKSGRINACGLNSKNVEYVAKAIDDVVRNAV